MAAVASWARHGRSKSAVRPSSVIGITFFSAPRRCVYCFSQGAIGFLILEVCSWLLGFPPCERPAELSCPPDYSSPPQSHRWLQMVDRDRHRPVHRSRPRAAENSTVAFRVCPKSTQWSTGARANLGRVLLEFALEQQHARQVPLESPPEPENAGSLPLQPTQGRRMLDECHVSLPWSCSML